MGPGSPINCVTASGDEGICDDSIEALICIHKMRNNMERGQNYRILRVVINERTLPDKIIFTPNFTDKF